jgi:hypothetical protein
MPRSPVAEAKDPGPIAAADPADRITDHKTVEWTRSAAVTKQAHIARLCAFPQAVDPPT